MAPEVVRGELYDARCDWWSVAVILYEVSIPPLPPLLSLLVVLKLKISIVSLRIYTIPCRRRR
jgi:serine/threonine protein kinase